MFHRSTRSAATALILATVLFLAVPAQAQAADTGLAERIATRVEQIAHRGGDLAVSLWQGLTEFVAASTATICGDG